NEVDWESDPEIIKEQYRNLNKCFNPARLRPEVWADVAARNGFRYFIFTTKHHDGFCLFDSKYTDYKTTSPDCPFHTHKYADVTKAVFDAFRARGIAIAAYFSKPDWHCPWYWTPGMDKPIAADRNPTYKPAEHPELWESFVEFTHNQMMELVRDYGPIDILWLDGGQVRPSNGQDIRLSEFVKKAREINPTLLTADRTVGGENENYITPEQSVPAGPIRVPWESCVTVGYAFSYRFKERYKTSRQLVHLLIDVVCRGGNLALNIAPQPDGTLPADAVKSVDGMGDWLRENGEAIYGTRLADPNEDGITAFTKKGGVHYALVRLPEGERLGETLTIPWPHEANRLTLLSLGGELAFERTDAGLCVKVPEILRGHNPIAPVIRIEK
ncbi:MAG: alpha-L-fucosidase, partial [Clostridia bacterium]|nr:alpha-L-fucosidase [Clostridia bacterium]